jgi:hypothetical protein
MKLVIQKNKKCCTFITRASSTWSALFVLLSQQFVFA